MNNKTLIRKTNLLILLVAIAILLLGCFSTPTESTNPLITASPSPTFESTATAFPTRKPTATFPPTRTPLPPQTDLPTIVPNSINSMVDSLYSRCELPCWGGIIPGKTSQYAAKRFLSPLGEWYNPVSPSGEWDPLAGVTVEYNNLPASISLLLEHGLVRSIHLDTGLTRPYRINRLFTEYGMPEDVLIDIVPLTADLTSWFFLVLLYPEQGIMAILEGEATPINSIIHVCPRNISPRLRLFAPNTYSLDEMKEILSVVFPVKFYPLDTLTDVNINQFYEIFSNQNTTCIPTKFEFQLPP
ncbi:MAG: hypothetical protein JNK81_12190 [Anaerolineales bacterium]|nr:hypothetical protein [Anaerolineales bacterium]